MWNNLTDFTCLRITGSHNITVRISLVLIVHLKQVLGHDIMLARRLAQHHIPEHLNFHEQCCENLMYYMLHLLIRVFHDYWTSEFLYALLFLILRTKIDMNSVFGLCQYSSIPISAFLHFSPSVFCSPQNFHFVVYFISLHISLLSFMTNCIFFNL